MKLIRFYQQNSIKPGLLEENGRIIDCSDFGEDYDETFFGSGGIGRLRSWLAEDGGERPRLELDGTRLAPPVARPSKLVCIGLNYAGHAREAGASIPDEPVLFMKATSAITGPGDDLVLPPGSEKTDWEVELGVLIGKKASNVSEEAAGDHVAGYLLHNDYSERAWQTEHGGQWVKGKSADTFAPLGPFLATSDEIPDPHSLRLWLTVNGEKRQDSTTADMIFKVPFLVSYVSRFMTLLPGDILSTGTPEGVGMGFSPKIFLRPGDVVELGIDGLGSSRQRVRAHPADPD